MGDKLFSNVHGLWPSPAMDGRLGPNKLTFYIVHTTGRFYLFLDIRAKKKVGRGVKMSIKIVLKWREVRIPTFSCFSHS